MKTYVKLLESFFVCIFFTAGLKAEIRLPSLFSGNMVLQQQTEVAIWGWAGKGANVILKTSWDGCKYETRTDENGKWKVMIKTPAAGGPYDIKISDGKVKTISNVLIGEVWLCSGQSNMEMPMKGYTGQPVLGSNDAILRSKNTNIRFITVPRSSKTEVQDDFEGRWMQAEPATVVDFSATAYYFARLLHEILDVPVGLIHVSYGGSCIETWMSRETSEPYLGVDIPQPGDSVKVPNRTPTVLFNSMLSPVIGYTLKGAIWYQGETNYMNPDEYARLFATMVKEWRALWGQGEFPFYYAQIAPFNNRLYKPRQDYYEKLNSAYLREAQLKAMDVIPNCGMAVLMDIGEELCIHPADKKTGSERLAYWALAKTYGIEGIGYASPLFKEMTVNDTSVVLSFYNIPNGLTSFGKEVTTFEVAGNNRVFYPARASLRRTTVVLTCREVKEPVAVRYAFKDFVVGDLFTTEGIPVSSFRTDDW
ncbi:MAG: sialate O-acetylesterase [Bacteroidales bacterium]|nr:sialate O-acetylesterase [Bacteroidales bacterium]